MNTNRMGSWMSIDSMTGLNVEENLDCEVVVLACQS